MLALCATAADFLAEPEHVVVVVTDRDHAAAVLSTLMYTCSLRGGEDFDPARTYAEISDWTRSRFGRTTHHNHPPFFVRHWSTSGLPESILAKHTAHSRPLRVCTIRLFGAPTNLDDPFRPFVMIIQKDAAAFSSLNLPGSGFRSYDAATDTMTLELAVPIDGDFIVRAYHLPRQAHGIKLCEFALHTLFVAEQLTHSDPRAEVTVMVHSDVDGANPAIKFPKTSRFQVTFELVPDSELPVCCRNSTCNRHESQEPAARPGVSPTEIQFVPGRTTASEEDSAGAAPDTSHDEEMARKLQAQFEQEMQVESRQAVAAASPAPVRPPRDVLQPPERVHLALASATEDASETDEDVARRLQDEFNREGMRFLAQQMRRVQVTAHEHDERDDTAELNIRPPRLRAASAATPSRVAFESPIQTSSPALDASRDATELRRVTTSRTHRHLRRPDAISLTALLQSAGPLPLVLSDPRRATMASQRPATHTPATRSARVLSALPVSAVPLSSPLLDQECQVCFDAFEVGVQFKTLPCLHKYHVGCIDEWLARKMTCPVCLNPL